MSNYVLVQPIAILNNTPVVGVVQDRSETPKVGYRQAPSEVDRQYLYDFTSKTFTAPPEGA
jgi:hypothetical protein